MGWGVVMKHDRRLGGQRCHLRRYKVTAISQGKKIHSEIWHNQFEKMCDVMIEVAKKWKPDVIQLHDWNWNTNRWKKDHEYKNKEQFPFKLRFKKQRA